MSGIHSFTSVEAAERGERQQADLELRHAINNHADNLSHLNTHHEQMHADIAKLKDQMDAVLDSLTQINRRLDALEKPATTKNTTIGYYDVEGGHA